MTKPSYLIEAARRERRLASPAQGRVWEMVRNGGVGVKFRRQHPVRASGRDMILDFCSPRAKLAIEFADAGVPVFRRDLLDRAGFRVLWTTTSAVFADGFEDRLREFVTRP